MKIPLKYPDAYGDKEIGYVIDWHKEIGKMSVKISDPEAKELIESMILNGLPISMCCKNEPCYRTTEGNENNT